MRLILVPRADFDTVALGRLAWQAAQEREGREIGMALARAVSRMPRRVRERAIVGLCEDMKAMLAGERASGKGET